MLQPALPFAHGPLMVSGFPGTLINLERAVALGRPAQAVLVALILAISAVTSRAAL